MISGSAGAVANDVNLLKTKVRHVKTDSTHKAQNPILWADVPDVAIVRVGRTYYMSSTTMHMSPGLPIMKSTDLVNWKIASYAYETLADTDELNLKGGKNDYGRGSWASSLAYHDGTFYATTFSLSTGKTYIFRTKNPNKTPWKATSFAPLFGDHSLYFDDDGRAYIVHGNNGQMRITELKSDLTGVQPGGLDQAIIPNASTVAPGIVGLPAEGSQFRKINGKYYLCNIVWPKRDMRTEIIHRADQLTGPYEGRVLFHDQGIAQGGLIDTPKGDWFAYLFQDHGAVGRIPFLVPVKWVDGWPVLGVDGKAPTTLNLPASKLGVSGIVASDEFDRRPGDRPLPLAWQWNHNPDNANWSLAAHPGSLRLTAGRVDPELSQARNTLTQRTFGPESSATTAVDVSHMKDGDFAGLTVFQKKYGFVGVKATGDARSIVMVSAKSNKPEEITSIPLAQKTVFLKIDCDFKDRADKAYFYYSLNGKDWSAIGESLHMVYDIPHFMGYRFGLFNFATKTAGGFVDFDFFRLSDKITALP
ncbi:glycoside hydrolase family 43 [Fimbriimonas ginsengisoli Gsoil 348]|uniref:Glycoside hydrolase family 43 n=2 Tax=Fimbriimonas ginsengisoli TaxID=1005039 RepID=A0A068NJI0_FIMGI|nr:glycoside hydrolase family 43 [Fimbriimonas ginsengisoli Gsoil 348]